MYIVTSRVSRTNKERLLYIVRGKKINIVFNFLMVDIIFLYSSASHFLISHFLLKLLSSLSNMRSYLNPFDNKVLLIISLVIVVAAHYDYDSQMA